MEIAKRPILEKFYAIRSNSTNKLRITANQFKTYSQFLCKYRIGVFAKICNFFVRTEKLRINLTNDSQFLGKNRKIVNHFLILISSPVYVVVKPVFIHDDN